jgi:hypothetical protein
MTASSQPCQANACDRTSFVRDTDVLRRIRAEFECSLALNARQGRASSVAVGDPVRVVPELVELARPLAGAPRLNPPPLRR